MTNDATMFRQPTSKEVEPFLKAMRTFMDTISYDAKPANLCIYAAFPADELHIESSKGLLRVYCYEDDGKRRYLEAIKMEFWLFHYPEQGAARTVIAAKDVDDFRDLIETPRPCAATYHFKKLRLQCTDHGDSCYRFTYDTSRPNFQTTKSEWENDKPKAHLSLSLYEKLNALDDLILGTFDHVYFGRIPYLSVPIAALFQPCQEVDGETVEGNFSSSLMKLCRAAPIYVLSAIREVAECYAMRVEGALNADMGKKVASLCVDLAIASVLFPVRITLRGMKNCYASSEKSLRRSYSGKEGKGYDTWAVKRGKNGPVVFLDHHNYYLDNNNATCRKASELKRSEMFFAAIKDIEGALADVISQSRPGQYAKRCEVRYVMFEFFMPLAREDQLRTALDDIFYRDRILKMLDQIEETELAREFGAKKYFPELIGYVCEWIDRNFVGYSISHVAGRFRAHHLKESREAVLPDVKSSTRYLMDETTAAVRFIFPCPGTAKEEKAHAEKVRFIFGNIFVTQMIESVKEENQIWLLESGMQNRLYRWEKRPDQKKGDPGTEGGVNTGV